MSCSARHNNIVDLEDHTHALSGQSNSAVRHKGRLNDFSLVHLFDDALLDVEAGESLVVSVAIAELGHENDGVQARILGESVGDQFEGLTEGTHNVGVRTEDFTGVLLELVGDFHFDTGATVHEGSLLNEGTDDTKGIVEGTVSLVEDQSV